MSFYLFGRKYTPGLNLKSNENQKKRQNYRKWPLIPSNNRTKITNKDTFDLFSCSKNVPEAYQCYYCNFKTDYAVEFNKHVAETKLKPSKTFSKSTSKYLCENCNFETFSRLVLLKHAHMKCLLEAPNSVLVLARDPKRPSDYIKLLYCKPNLLKPKCNNTVEPNKPKRKSPTSVICCKDCDFQTTKRITMKNHVIKKHTPEENIDWLRCKQCPYKAKVRSQLNRHLFKEHTTPEKVVWYKCEDCDYRSIWKSYLLRHYKAQHTLFKMYQCDQCSYTTKYVSHLHRHVKQQHSEDFQWLQCEHCPYKAKQKIHMKLHSVQKHTPLEEIKWYECDKCSYKAKIKASLKNHVLKKHAWLDQWFVCEKCGYKAKNKGSLKKHLQNTHG